MAESPVQGSVKNTMVDLKVLGKVTLWAELTICILFLFITLAHAQTPQPAYLTASWYSVESLKKEGTYKTSKGVMANGKKFSDTNLSCATRLYPIGAILNITNSQNNRSVRVVVTDRIGKRFAKKRIDLSRLAFSRIAKLERGLVAVKVEVIK